MKKLLLTLTFLLYGLFANAQTITIPDANFKAKLLAASPSNLIAYNLSNTSFKIDANNDGEIQESEALQVKRLNVYQSNISSLEGIQYFTNLTNLRCENNQLTSLNVSGNIALTSLFCFNNQLTSLNVSSNTALTDLSCGGNQLTSLVGIEYITNLTYFSCLNNQLTSLDLSNNTALINLNCGVNQLTSLDVSNNSVLNVLRCHSNQLTNLNVTNTALTILSCYDNQLTSLDVSNKMALSSLWVYNNLLTTLNVNNNIALTELLCGYNQLTNLFIKNNKNETTLDFSNNPNLTYICADEGQLADVQTKINSAGYATTCHVNSYCSFVPGGAFYTIQGTNTLDNNNNGCEVTDGVYPNQKFTLTNGSVLGGLIANTSGNYSYSVQSGTHTITPVFENPSYYNVSPSSASVTFPATASPFVQNFCITPNGLHHNVEITLLPITVARPGFDATYKLVYKNTGNQVESGAVTFTYLNQDAYDIVSCNPAFNTENSDGFEKTLTWNYTNLQPLESRVIMVVLNLNGPMETPALNIGDTVNISSAITPVITDENPIDNQSDIRQVIVGSYDPNDKTCLEGTIISPDMVNKYVHYLIRFENTGTYPAQNVVVKDMIDTTKFDISTLTPIDGSHAFETRIAGNKVEFIFQNINLPFADATNDGYVAFKIKTKPTLVLGDTFSNLANIYFDYNFPIITNTATTTIQTLGAPTFDFDANFTMYPNPAKNEITLSAKNEMELNSVEIYNTLGQLILVVANAENTSTIDVSALLSGTYFVKVNTDKGVSSSKLIKE